jgi:hypothetical protein
MSNRFDASTDKISYSATAPPDPQSGFSVSFWAYLVVDQSLNETMCRIWGASDSTRLNVATNSGGTTPSLFTPGNTGGVAGGDALGTAQWGWIGVTQTGTTATIYTSIGLGTVHSNSGTASGGNTASGITFGGRSPSDNSEWFNGRIVYARYWGAVLNSTEMQTERASATPVRTSNLWAAWPLTSSSDLTDQSGNGRDLVAGSTATSTEADPTLSTPFVPIYTLSSYGSFH